MKYLCNSSIVHSMCNNLLVVLNVGNKKASTRRLTELLCQREGDVHNATRTLDRSFVETFVACKIYISPSE